MATLRRIESTAVERPPVIFISIDTLAAKHLPFHGYERDTAPELTEFTKDAVTFDHCVTNAPWTVPSFMSQMTGLYAYANRLESRTKEQAKAELWEKWYLSQNRWTMAEFMRAAGYATGGFADNLWITERFGFPQGFDAFDTSAGTIAKPDPEGGIRHVVGLAKEWLEGRVGEAPFFLFLHAFDVHGPYTPSAPYAQLFEDQKLYSEERMAPVRGRSDSLGVIHDYLMYGEAYQGIQAPSRIQTRSFSDAYDQGIAMTDADVGKFFDYLREQRDLGETLVIVTSDHGEAFGEHGKIGHQFSLQHVLMHALMVFHGPDLGIPPAKRKIHVSLIDVLPTLQDWIGLPSTEGTDGRSLRPYLGEELPSMKEQREFRRRTLFGHRQRFRVRQGKELETLWAVVRGPWKLIDDGQRQRLYHLEKDPGESRNRARFQEDLVVDMVQQLDAFRAQGIRTSDTQTEVELDLETLQSLRALGYIQ